MDGFTQQRRGLFDGLKVPALDISAIFLGVIAILLWKAGISVVSWTAATEIGNDTISSKPTVDLVSVMLGNLLSYFGSFGKVIAAAYKLPLQSQKLSLVHYIGFYGWSLAVWAFFSAAMNRIAAMKLAREEGVEIAEAIKFGFKKFLSNVFTVASALGIVAVLYGLCNASIGGNLASIPYVGDILLMVLFFLILGSSFMIVFFLAMTLLGFNMASSAIATEASDAFDGVSRSWNYILSKPWAFLISNFLILLYITLFLTFGGLFLRISVTSMSIGDYGLGSKSRIVPAGPEAQQLMKQGDNDADSASRWAKQDLSLPGKGEYLYNRIIVQGDRYVGSYYTRKTTTNGSAGDSKKSSVRYYKRQYLQKQPDGSLVDVLPAIKNQGLFYWAGEAVFWWMSLCQLIMYAYALNYFFAGQTTIYFMLRKEVDGDDYNEIILGTEDDDDLFDLPSYPGQGGPSAPPPSGGDGGKGPGGDNKDQGGGGDKTKSLPMVMEV